MNTASAPAKIIILGEHTALYGKPVLSAALDLRSHVIACRKRGGGLSVKAPSGDSPLKRSRRGMEMVRRGVKLVGGGGFDIRVQTEIPISSGLGSSASIASALMMALSAEAGKKWGLNDIARAAWKCEDAVHAKSSGVDPFTVTFGGVSLYQAGKIRPVKLKERPGFVIAHSGLTHETGDIVKELEEIRKNDRARFDKFLKDSEKLALQGRDAVEGADWEKLGRLMDENHELLKGMGVSCKELDEMADIARKNGAYGAKLSGAGRGGVIIAIIGENSRESVSKALSNMGKKVIEADISEEGTRKE
jgi:mevalonate kinase